MTSYLNALMKNLDENDIYKNISNTEQNNEKKSNDIINTIDINVKVNGKPNQKLKKKVNIKKEFKPSDKFNEALDIMLNEFNLTNIQINDINTNLQHVINWNKVLNFDFEDDKIRLGEKEFSRERIFNSKHFQISIKDKYETIFNIKLFIKFLNSNQKNKFKLLIKTNSR